jgi:hypothetical protein
MKKDALRKIGNGFYVDEYQVLYLDLKEYLKANLLPDQAVVRMEIWQKVQERFGRDGIKEIFDEGE